MLCNAQVANGNLTLNKKEREKLAKLFKNVSKIVCAFKLLSRNLWCFVLQVCIEFADLFIFIKKFVL
jgi:hypothetical protein